MCKNVFIIILGLFLNLSCFGDKLQLHEAFERLENFQNVCSNSRSLKNGFVGIGDLCYFAVIDDENNMTIKSMGREEAEKKMSNPHITNCKNGENGFDLPDNEDRVTFFCNGSGKFVIGVIKDENEDKITIKGWRGDDKDGITIKEIAGKLVVKIDFSWGKFRGFVVASNIHKAENAKAHYLALINLSDGTIIEMDKEFSVSAAPVLDYNEVYFIGLDGDLYRLNHYGEIMRVWINNSGGKIIKIGPQKSSVLIRKGGKNFYKTFDEKNVFCEKETANDMVAFCSLDCCFKEKNGIYESSYDCGGEMSFFATEEPGELPKGYIRREGEALSESFEFLPIKNLDVVFKEVLSKVDIDNLENETNIICDTSFLLYKDIVVEELLLLDLNEKVESEKIVVPYSIEVINPKDGVVVPAHVYPPYRVPGDDSERPIIIDVHGGPNMHVDISPINLLRQYLASEGFWVVCPEARGSSGYGEEHEAAIINDWGGGHLDDIIAVANYIKGKDGVDSNNVFLMGHSFGGYATLAIATLSPYVDYFDGYVSIAGISDVGKDIKDLYDMEDRNRWMSKETELESWRLRIGFDAYKDYENNEGNRAISPYYHAYKLSKPLLLIHGKKDDVALPNQSEDFYEKAKELGKDVELILVDDAGHNFKSNENFPYITKTPTEFFRKIMQNKEAAEQSDVCH